MEKIILTEEEIKRWVDYFNKIPVYRALTEEEARIKIRIEAIKIVNKIIEILNSVDNILEELKKIKVCLVNDIDYYSNNLCISYFCAKYNNLEGYLDYLYIKKRGKWEKRLDKNLFKNMFKQEG